MFWEGYDTTPLNKTLQFSFREIWKIHCRNNCVYHKSLSAQQLPLLKTSLLYLLKKLLSLFLLTFHIQNEMNIKPMVLSSCVCLLVPQTSNDLGAQGTCGCLCPADLQSPHCGPHWPGPGLEESVTLSPPLPPPGSTILLGCHLQDLLPHPPPHGGLRSLRASWAGHPAPSAMTAEQGLRTRPWGSSSWALTQPGLDPGGYVVPQDLPFLVRTETNTHEIFRGTVTWPCPDPQNKGSDIKMFKQLTTPLPHLPRKGLHWELAGSLGCLKHEALLSLQGPQCIFLGSIPWPSVLG